MVGVKLNGRANDEVIGAPNVVHAGDVESTLDDQVGPKRPLVHGSGGVSDVHYVDAVCASQAVPSAPKPAPQISTPNSLPTSEKQSRGPHIAKVELLPASELDY